MNPMRILTARPHRLLTPVLNELKRHEDDSVLFLVPEHLTVATEEAIMAQLHKRCLMNIQVLSPTKLYNNLMHFIGKPEGEPLSSMGYRMAIAQTMENMEDKLRYYRRVGHFPGMVEKLAALITDLKRGGMTPDMLRNAAMETADAVTSAKYLDLADILEKYQALLGNRFYDRQDRMAFLCHHMSEAEILQGKVLYVYGFDTVTQELIQLLKFAFAICKQVNLALVCDPYSPADGSLYMPVQESMERLIQAIGGKGNAEIIHLPQEELCCAPDIAAIDHLPFRGRMKPYAGKPEHIAFRQSVHPYEEAKLVSRLALDCLTKGVALSDMVILYPNDPNYIYAVSAALKEAQLPFFDNRPMKAAGHRLSRFWLTALRAIESQWANEDMLPLLESPYLPLSFAESCRLRRYAVAFGIEYKQWEVPFHRGEAAEELEPLRLRLMEPLLNCRKALLAAENAKASLAAAFGLLADTGVYEKLKQEAKRLEDEGFAAHADRCTQIWQVILDMLEETLRLEGENRLPLSHIADRFENALSAEDLKPLPPSGECLQIGTLDHLLAQHAKVAFLMGLNEGVLLRETVSLLRPEEKAQAEAVSGCFLGMSDTSLNLLSELDLRKAMTLPKERLFLTCSETNMDGTPREPLQLLRRLRERGFAEEIPCIAEEDSLPASAYQTEMVLAATPEGELSAIWKERAAHLQADVYESRLASSLRYSPEPVPLREEAAARLYGDRYLSVSRLESFADCPFMHYVRYGLRPLENEEWKIDSRKTGSFCHNAMDRFGKNALELPSYPLISGEELSELCDRTLAPMMEELRDDLFLDGARNEAVLKHCVEAFKSSAKNVTEQLSEGSFRLWKTEAEFGYGTDFPPILLRLSSGRTLALRGRIDRIDRAMADGYPILQVIDYKSSKKELLAGKITYGLQLQLLLYLSVCTEAGAGSIPGGAFYFHIFDPLVESGVDEAETVKAQLRKQFNLCGILVKEVQELESKDGKPPVQSTIEVTWEQMKVLLRKTRQLAAVLAERLLKGDTSIDPSCYDGTPACEYCRYGLICKIDRASPELAMREIENISRNEFVDSLQTEIEKGKEGLRAEIGKGKEGL